MSPGSSPARWLQSGPENVGTDGAMAEIEETLLPGVGVRHDFTTRSGRRIGVITHRGGDRDLVIYDQNDPDRSRETVRLDEQDLQAVAEMLGASQIRDRVAAIQQSVEGLTIDWIPVRESSAAKGRTIGETQLRRRTGVSIVAIVRGEDTLPSPGPETRLDEGDTAVVVGTPDGIARAFALLQGQP